ncbi:MAG: UDP-N-acetylmuramate dehydrogenase [Clostridiales bacterium]|nr:UDP-N-acetylmuramate dehydrogenase [Clostridiales bacterium]
MDAATRQSFISALKESLPKKQVTENVPLSRYTTLRLGGPAEIFCEVASVSQLSAALLLAAEHDQPVTILGNGSNLLVRDGGILGVVIHIGSMFSDISAPVPLPDGSYAITAQSGATLQKLCNLAAEHGLGGLEFASGIPGTIGGAVCMNAGAYGGEMKDVVLGVTALDQSGKTIAYSGEEMQFGYRRSALNQSGELLVATSATFCLREGDAETILATMREFSARRREKQPITLPSCGSTFKRPQGQFAGTLIEQAGLKGHRIGGASVSELHAGFLVNDQKGTAEDYLALIAHVQRTVHSQSGVMLEPEVQIIGEINPVTEV